MTTRADLIEQVAREFGGYTGTVSSGTATTAVLGGLIGASGDDYLMKGAVLYFPAAATADQERIVTNWVDRTGTATFSPRADTDPSAEAYVAFPKNTYTITTVRQEIDNVLTKTRRTWRTELILNPDQRSYPVRNTWLRNRKDIDAVHYRVSQNLIVNEDFSQWDGTECTGWTLSTGATQSSDLAVGDYSLQIEYDGAPTRTARQSIPLNFVRWTTSQLGDRTLSVGVLVAASSASTTRVIFNDGIDESTSSYHSGSGRLEWLTFQHVVNQNATQGLLSIAVEDTDTATVARAICHSGTPINEVLQRTGSSAYTEQEITHNARNVGLLPIVEIPIGLSGQLQVYSRRPYSVPASDATELDIPEQVLFHGVMYNLTSLHRRSEDRTRLDRLALMHGNAYRQLASDLIDVPVPMPMGRLVLHGA